MIDGKVDKEYSVYYIYTTVIMRNQALRIMTKTFS